MKTTFLSCALFVITLLVACTAKPDELIIGKWKFDHISVPKKSDQNSEQIAMIVAMTEARFENVTIEYFADKTFEGSMPSENSTVAHGTYRIESDGKYLITTNEKSAKEKRKEIAVLNSDTLAMGDEEGTIYFVRVK